MMSLRRVMVLISTGLVISAMAGNCGGGGSGGGPDKVTCAVDQDCDSDETCVDGSCTGLPDPCTSNADCDSDEICTNGDCV
jgi:hypothetical protein